MNVTKLQECLIFYNLTEQEERVLTDWIAGKIPTQKNILPRPVIRDGNGKLTKNYSPRDWYLKLQEEIFEVMEIGVFEDEDVAEEIADIITVCISWLESLGFTEEKRSEIFAAVNEKNKKRGYFEE